MPGLWLSLSVLLRRYVRSGKRETIRVCSSPILSKAIVSTRPPHLRFSDLNDSSAMDIGRSPARAIVPYPASSGHWEISPIADLRPNSCRYYCWIVTRTGAKVSSLLDGRYRQDNGSMDISSHPDPGGRLIAVRLVHL